MAAAAPDYPNVHFGLGYLYWKKRQYDLAEPEFKREIETAGSVARAKTHLGDIYLRRKQYEEAKAVLQQAVRLDPSIRIAHLDLGIIYTEQREYDRAVEALTEAVRLGPEQADAHFRLAATYRAMGRREDKDAELREVRRLHEKTREDLLHKISGPPPAPSID
ncbi:MAG TPA: tetratricopeptide repeat protein [Terriglobia bacterium]|nr:tetratricopeptide repeat protein [Terriglobia bacterium]